MNRLTSKLQNLKENNKKALVAYLVAGDPDLDTSIDLMHLFVDSGVDVIEIGVPFTDPIAEGPTIQKAHDRALKNNISLKMILELVDKFRETNTETPIVLMGYLNTFISHIDLVQSIGENSADSILVVDVPGELNLQTYGITNPNINTISLISPTTKDDRVESIAKNSTGFIYYVTLRGVTGSSNLNIEEIKKADIHQAAGLKVFMGASTGHMLVDDLDALDDIFHYSPLIVVTHCEDQKTVERNEQLFHEKYGEGVSPEHHHLIRDVESCYISSSLAVSLAKKYDADLHVFHLTTEKEMELFSAGEADQKKITAEVCVHHMYFNDSYYAELGNQIKCNPSIKQESDRQALIKALLENKIDIIATDHAPHTWEEKSRAYTEAPAGLPLVQHGLQILMDLYHQDVLSLETIVEKTSHNIAKRFQVKDRGYIREGYYADLAILDHEKPYEVSKENILYKCGWSPFEGHSFKSSIFMTIINGNIAFQDGRVSKNLPFGMQIEFDR